MWQLNHFVFHLRLFRDQQKNKEAVHLICEKLLYISHKRSTYIWLLSHSSKRFFHILTSILICILSPECSVGTLSSTLPNKMIERNYKDENQVMKR
jgi:hypothetical protein